MSLSVAGATAIAGALSTAGSVGSSAMQNARNMRMWRAQNRVNTANRAEDYRRFLENREYNSASSQMARLRQAGISASGAASSVTGSNASSSMSSSAPTGPSPGGSAPQMTAPDLSRLGSVYQDAANIANTNSDTILKQQEGLRLKQQTLTEEYNTAIASNNAAVAAATQRMIIENKRLDNLLTLQQVYKTEAETGLTKAETFNEWIKQTNRERELDIQAYAAHSGRIQADASRTNAATAYSDFLARSPYYGRTGLSPTVNAINAGLAGEFTQGLGLGDFARGLGSAAQRSPFLPFHFFKTFKEWRKNRAAERDSISRRRDPIFR